jgi:hypothetical protein
MYCRTPFLLFYNSDFIGPLGKFTLGPTQPFLAPLATPAYFNNVKINGLSINV